MDLHIRFSFDAPRGAGARLARFFGVPVAVVMAAGAAAYAYDTTWVASSQPLSASKLKADLDEGQTRLAALESLTQQQATALGTLQGQLTTANANITTLNGLVTATAAPSGTIVAFGGSAAPPGWVLCDGSAYDKTSSAYTALGAAIGTTYGSVAGNTNLFKVPDLRGRTTFGMDAMGGAVAGRLTKATTQGVDGTKLGNVGGEEAHKLLGPELALHTHAGTFATSAHAHTGGALRAHLGFDNGSGVVVEKATASWSVNWSGSSGGTWAPGNNAGPMTYGVVVDGTTSAPTDSSTVGNTGSDQYHNNVPPALVVTYVIKL